MNTIHAQLSSVLRVTETSVLFVPSPDHAIDLETISCAPAAHRQLLQENGLVAKVWIALDTQTSADKKVHNSIDNGANAIHAYPARSSPERSMDRNTPRTLTPDERVGLWTRALQEANLIDKSSGKCSVLAECITSAVVWPLVSIEDYADRRAIMHARKSASAVSSSSSSLPILSMQEITLMTPHGRAWMTVIWMPRYPMDLATWSRCYLDHNQWPPEKALISLVHSVTQGLLALHTMDDTISSMCTHTLFALTNSVKPHSLRESAEWCPSPRRCHWELNNLTMDKVLVCQDNGTPRFVLSTSPLFDRRRTSISANAPHLGDAEVEDETEDEELRMSRCYLAPEQIVGPVVPVQRPRCEVWALGVMTYLVACGRTRRTHAPALPHPLPREGGYHRPGRTVRPLNHPRLTPDTLAQTVRRDLKCGAYSGVLKGLILLLLGQDDRTRPSLTLLDRLLQDLNRDSPLHRFPFTLGSLDLIKVPEPASVQIHLTARRYRSREACCACRHPRPLRRCRSCQREMRATSGSWSGVELLPGLMTVYPLQMMYLYPLIDAHTDERMRRHLLRRALPPGRPSSRSNNTDNDVHVGDSSPSGGCTAAAAAAGGGGATR